MADRFYAQQTDYIYQLNQLNDFVMNYTGGGGGSYVLPTATSSVLGGIKVGTNLTIAAGVLSADASPQLQADWNEPSSSSKAYILNKPTINPLSMTQPFQTDRDFTNGTLVVTDIAAGNNLNPFLLEVKGNSYALAIPIDVTVQGYPYTGSSAFINTGGISNGQGIPGLVVFVQGGVICFWWPTQGYWLGYQIFVSEVGDALSYKKNRVVSVTDVVKPTTGVTWELALTIRQSLHTGTHPNVENKSSATIRGEITSSNVTTALTYTPVQSTSVGFLSGGANSFTMASINGASARSISNPAVQLGCAGGARFRFAHANDVDTTQNYADVIDLSTYIDATGGGFNSLYFNKATHKIEHKFAPAGSTAWTQVNTIPYANGTHASGTWGISITGNAATASSLSTDRGNYKGVTDLDVVGQLMWKYYGNSHTIFDASAGTTPDNTACSNTDPINAWTAQYPTLMGFNGYSTYGVRVDIAKKAETLVSGATGSTLNLNNTTNPSLYLWDTDAGTNLGRWGMYTTGANLLLGPATDAGTVTTGLSIDRSQNVSVGGLIKTDTGLVSHSAVGYRMKTSSGAAGYSLIHYIDAGYYYQLITDLNDANGSFNSLRPYYVNLLTGRVGMLHGLTVAQGITCANNLVVQGTADFTDIATITGATPAQVFNEGDQTGSVGLWRWIADGGSISLQRATTARSFATATAPIIISASDVVTVNNPVLNTNNGQVATCAFVLGQAATATPLADGTAAVGTATTFARADHVHPGTPSAVTLLAAVACTAVSSIDFLTLFSSTYDSYTVEVLGATPATSGAGLQMRLAVAGTVITAGQYGQLDMSDPGAVLGGAGVFNLSGAVASSSKGVTAHVRILNVNGGGVKQCTSHAVAEYTAGGYAKSDISGIFYNTGVVTGFRLLWTGGNFQASGTIRVYGYRNS